MIEEKKTSRKYSSTEINSSVESPLLRVKSNSPTTFLEAELESTHDWYKHEIEKYSPIYGSLSADLSVFFANIFMLAYGIDILYYAAKNKDNCMLPLRGYIILKCIFVFLNGTVCPIIHFFANRNWGITHTLFCELILLLIHLQWLFLGYYYLVSDNNCDHLAPFLYSGLKWFLAIYTVVLPIQIAWRTCLGRRKAFREKNKFKEKWSSVNI